MGDRIPVDRFGSPDELADLASILLSDLTAYMNGEVVTFDGGEALSAGGQFNTFARMPREQVKAMMERMRPD
jgi:enoyl-[acyl-carrier-protein] reductase (NADH)